MRVSPRLPVGELDKKKVVNSSSLSQHHKNHHPSLPSRSCDDQQKKRHQHSSSAPSSPRKDVNKPSKPDPLGRTRNKAEKNHIDSTATSSSVSSGPVPNDPSMAVSTTSKKQREGSSQAITTRKMASSSDISNTKKKKKRSKARMTGTSTVALSPPTVHHDDDHDSISSSLSLQQQQYRRTIILAEFFLATVILLSVGWVCLFTTLSTHTDINRKMIYESLESKYFPEKAGALVVTYLVVGYMWIGAVTYGCLYCWNLRLPRPTLWMVQSMRIPTSIPLLRFKKKNDCFCCLPRIELMAIALFLAVQSATFISRVANRFETPWWPTERVWYEVSKTFGKTLALTMMILLFPITKQCCFWSDLFNFQFERALKFHRWLAWFLVWMTALHAITAVIPLWMTGEFRHCMWPNEECQKPGGWGSYKGSRTSQIYTYGWWSLLVMIPLVVTSLPWFRRQKFEWFYYTHFLFVPFLVFLHLHFQYMIYYMAPGLSAYVLDKVVWFIASRRRTKLVDLTIPAPGFVRVIIAVDPRQGTFLPGQWVQINIPTISFWEWHPMSVVAAPGHSTITIDIKVLGDWTRTLYNYCQQGLFDPSKPAHSCIFVDSFHGSSHTKAQGYLHHDAVVMVSGGIGVTPLLSALRTLVEQSTHSSLSHIQKCVFVWCVKKESVLDLYRQELARYQSFYSKLPSGCQLDIIVHCTNSEPEAPEEETPQGKAPPDPLSQRVHFCCDPCRHTKPEPFRQMLLGYGFQFGLTVLAGCGTLFGIFLVNVAAYDRAWRNESQSMLQLLLAVLFCILCTVPLVLYSWARTTNPYTTTTGDDGDDKESSCTFGVEEGHDPTFCELNVVFGCRPNISEILMGTKAFCEDRNIPSVGVSVCGPDKLVESVQQESRMVTSSPSIAFVVDEETFDW